MRKFALAMACGLAITHSMTIAETVYVPIGQQGSDKQGITKPRSGITKTQVQQRFGEPKDWRAAVGDPPISSWVYDDFTVYFEYDRVIHSVLSHRKINQ